MTTELVFLSGGETVRVAARPEDTLADLAFEAGLGLNTACGGNGVCERCAVTLRRGVFLVEGRRVEAGDGAVHRVLACRTRWAGEGEAEVEVPASSRVEEKAQIHDDFVLPPFLHAPSTVPHVVRVPDPSLEDPAPDAERLERALSGLGPNGRPAVPLDLLRALPRRLREGSGVLTVTVGPCGPGRRVLDLRPGDTSARQLAIAADIGTTTVVCALVDLVSGGILARTARYNQQIRKADDVGSRISFCRTPEDLRLMQRLIVEETLNPLIHEVCSRSGAAPADVVRAAMAGNTVMMHLLLGLPPGTIGVLPFQPVVARHRCYEAREIGLDVGRGALLDIVPSISGYVGGDVTADIHASRLLDRRGLNLLVDIGTNGEIVLWDRHRLHASATAAGPAFEGAGIRHGCRAAEGAIEHVRCLPGGGFEFRVIGHTRPTGLCGSAMVDFVAEGFRCGWILPTGRFDLDALRAAGRHLEVPHDGRTVHAFVVARAEESGLGEPIYLSEADVAEVLKAKAAVYAGMKTLLAARGRAFEDLDRIILAGGFARHLDLAHAVRIGLLPERPPETFEIIGNGALAGAYLALVDRRALDTYAAIPGQATPLELNLADDFETNYVDALMLPNMDPDAFPATRAALGG